MCNPNSTWRQASLNKRNTANNAKDGPAVERHQLAVCGSPTERAGGDVSQAKAVREIARALRVRLSGEVLQPGDAAFVEASWVWNAMVARTPGLIARCANLADVQTAVRCAAEAGIAPAVRCGGHSLAGFSTCEGGLVIDLSRLRTVSVDETARRAKAAGGCLLGTIDTALQQGGLVFPAGVVSHTGASGLILGGGTGWLTRVLGLSCDNVAEYKLVVARGTLVRANAVENAELYWALRGGGGNFGVVVEFELKVHPLTSCLLATAFTLEHEVVRTLAFWRDFMGDAPDELQWNISLRLAPHAAEVPPELRGKPVLTTSAVWFGEDVAGKRLLGEIFSVGRPVAVAQKRISYLTLQTIADKNYPHGQRYYTKSGYFMYLNETSIELLADALLTIPSANTQIELAYLGGAAARVRASETAFGGREAPFILNLLANWTEPSQDAAHVYWIRSVFEKLRPAMTPGVYTNFMSGDEQERVREAYQERWERLVAVKTQYDPQNVFRRNQNIPPRADTTAHNTADVR
jgi:FAD/FMN-containing dehydrogenase